MLLTSKVAARVQHHPGRAHLLPRILDRIDAEVVTDPEPEGVPSPWRTYRRCLEGVPTGISHLLVIQDDALPCRNLLAACERIARPEPICLFLAGVPILTAQAATRAYRRGERYVPVHRTEWVPVVALLWPVEKIAEFLGWLETARLPGDPNPRSDDAVVGRWARKTQQQIWATVPSLVQHPDEDASLIGRKARRSPHRMAHLWIGDDDPLDLNWGT